MVEIRGECADDGESVRVVVTSAFGADGQRVADLVDALRAEVAPAERLGLVAVEDGAVIGFVLFTRSRLDAPPRLVEVRALSPLVVTPGHQGAGVGSALVRRGLELLRDQGIPLVWLEGAPRLYPRLGFGPGGALGLRRPSLRIPEEAFQAIALAAHAPWMRGTVVYAQAFWDHDAVGLRDPPPPGAGSLGV